MRERERERERVEMRRKLHQSASNSVQDSGAEEGVAGWVVVVNEAALKGGGS
jgi:hypothetical protein